VPATLIRRTVKTVGCGTTILFGQTEMHGVISQTKLTDSPQDQAETVGQPLPDLEVKIADLVPGDAPGKVQKFVLRDRLSAGVLPIESAQEGSPERRRSCWTSGSSANQISFGLSICIGDRNAIIRLQPGAGRLPRPAAEVRRR